MHAQQSFPLAARSTSSQGHSPCKNIIRRQHRRLRQGPQMAHLTYNLHLSGSRAAESLVVLTPKNVAWPQPTRSPFDLIRKSHAVHIARRLRYLGIATTALRFRITRCLVRGSSPRAATSALCLGHLSKLYTSKQEQQTRQS